MEMSQFQNVQTPISVNSIRKKTNLEETQEREGETAKT